MIICPWCGTAYVTFQSNCRNCGGPLLAADESSHSSPNEDIPIPPSAPRPISPSYVWRLTFTSGRGIAGLVLGLLGLVFTMVGAGLTLGIITAIVGIPFLFLGLLLLAAGAILLFLQYQQAQNVVSAIRDGEAARGQVLDVQQNYYTRINGRYPWIVRYQFQANGQTHEGRVSTLNPPGERLQAGKPVYILYLPGSPQWSSIYPHP